MPNDFVHLDSNRDEDGYAKIYPTHNVQTSDLYQEVRLSYFKRQSTMPLANHFKAMKDYIFPIIHRIPNIWIDVIGYASREWDHPGGASGEHKNQELSEQRAREVAAHLRVRWVLSAAIPNPESKIKINVVMGMGASGAKGEAGEGDDRAVVIKICKPQDKPAPPPIEAPREKCWPYAIRFISNWELTYGKFGVAGGVLICGLRIFDKTNKLKADFSYHAAVAEVGVGLQLPIPFNSMGPVTNFNLKTRGDVVPLRNFYKIGSVSMNKSPELSLVFVSIGGDNYLGFHDSIKNNVMIGNSVQSEDVIIADALGRKSGVIKIEGFKSTGLGVTVAGFRFGSLYYIEGSESNYEEADLKPALPSAIGSTPAERERERMSNGEWRDGGRHSIQ